MAGRKLRKHNAVAKTIDVALIPGADTLKPHQLAALQALATGGRYRDAAIAAGVTTSQVWAWCRSYRPFRDALAAATTLHDKRVDVLEQALDGRDDDMSAALKAAHILGNGIGTSGDGSNEPRASVTIHISGGTAALGSSVRTLDALPSDDQ